MVKKIILRTLPVIDIQEGTTGSTALAAQNRGYSIFVVEDAVISENEELKKQAIDEFRELGLEIVSVD